MPTMSNTCFFHKRGRHRSYGRADNQLLHTSSIRIQWNTSQTLMIKKYTSVTLTRIFRNMSLET